MSLFAWIDPVVQKTVLWCSTIWHGLSRTRQRRDWVVGPTEIAGLVRAISDALPSSETALLRSHVFYDDAHDWVAPPRRTRFGRMLLGPWKLGELVGRVDGFIYVGEVGFLDRLDDHREYEFRFLRARGRRIVCYFTGNDIRSPKRSAEREQQTGEPNLATYLAETSPEFATEAYEARKRGLAEVAERYADTIFNADVGQIGYLTRPTEPFRYFHPDGEITDDYSKYQGDPTPVLVHAPSSPVVKGTQLVRAAIEELRAEGYRFEYVELVRRPHAEVRESLLRAHIVLNQFYSEVPGVFGVEALAAGCVVLMRADEQDEPSLAIGSNDAWVVTRHHQVTKHLRALLDAPETWEAQARRGVAWVREHAAASVSGQVLRETLGDGQPEGDWGPAAGR